MQSDKENYEDLPEITLTASDGALLDGIIIFKVGKESLGIELRYVQEVIEIEKFRSIPRISPKFKGIYNLRENIIPVLNLGYILFNKMGFEEDSQRTKTNKVVVINQGNNIYGLVVDEINEIVERSKLDYDDIPTAVETAIVLEYIADIAKFNNVIVKIMNLPQMMFNNFNLKDQNVDLKSYIASDFGDSEDRLHKEINLSNDQKDALKEIVNIASGKAVIALSKLIKANALVKIDIENVSIKDLAEIGVDSNIEPDEIIIGIRAMLRNDINGVVFLLFSVKELKMLLKEVENVKNLPDLIESIEKLDKATYSAIQEFGNIIISHFCAGISDFLKIDLYHDVPEMALGEYTGLMDGEIARLARDSDQGIFLKTIINLKERQIFGELVFIPYYDSIDKFINWLDVDHVMSLLSSEKGAISPREKSVQKSTSSSANKTVSSSVKPTSSNKPTSTVKPSAPAKSTSVAKPATPAKASSSSKTSQSSTKTTSAASTQLPTEEEKKVKDEAFSHVTSQKEFKVESSKIGKYEITDEDLDAFRELGNMGAGNAGNALSQMLNKKVYLEIPPAKLLKMSELIDQFGKAGEKTIGYIGTTSGFFESNIFLMFNNNHIENLMQIIMEASTKKKINSESDLNAGEKSAIMEISNILMGHYVSAIADFLKVQINPPDYQFFFKNPKLLFEELQRSSGDKELTAIIIETNIQVAQGDQIKGNFILILSPEVTERVKKRMVEVW